MRLVSTTVLLYFSIYSYSWESTPSASSEIAVTVSLNSEYKIDQIFESTLS